MMGPGFGAEIGRQITLLIILVGVVFFLLGSLTVWGLPKLWELIKPIIHSLTA